MAIFHLSMRHVSKAGTTVARAAHHTGKAIKSAGATGRASYLAGEKLNGADGKVVDYRSKSEGIEHSELVLPGGGTTDREKLWNAVDAHRTRRDAKNPIVARDMIVATPHELSLEQRIQLNRDFAQWIADRYQVAVDFGMHKHTGKELDAGSTEKNLHAHFLISERKVSPEGELGNLQRELNQLDRKLNGHKPAVVEIREAWERMANDALERAGSAERISCRTLKKQGIDRTPGKHRGAAATKEMRQAGKAVKTVRIEVLRGELVEIERSLRERHEAAAKRIAEINEQRRVQVSAHVVDHIGDIEAWQRDVAGQFMRAWASADRASALRRQLREIDQRFVMRAATKEEDAELRQLGRMRHRSERSAVRVEKVRASMKSLAADDVIALAEKKGMKRVRETEAQLGKLREHEQERS